MMREPLRDPDPSPGRGGKRRGGALQASSVQSTMEPSHLSCTLAAEEEEGAHGETEAIAIQPKKPVQRMPLLQKTWQKSRRTALLFQSPVFFCPVARSNAPSFCSVSRENLAEVLAMREPLRDPDPCGMISVKSTTSKRASRLPGGSLQCPRQRAHLQTGSCGKPGVRRSEAGDRPLTVPKSPDVSGLSPLCSVGSGFLSSCARPGGRRGLVQTLCPGRAAATFAA
ncbi:uncharacterized protein [Phaenicophaeus curvirostris]|uniref:uncharacterized protein isoform X2 n=1 Tax=Phaenicophaeus curvirostris TaxID=33595 RepID=UPI0037F0B0B1